MLEYKINGGHPTRFNLIAGLMSGIMQPAVALERKKKERKKEKKNIYEYYTGYAIAKEY